MSFLGTEPHLDLQLCTTHATVIHVEQVETEVLLTGVNKPALNLIRLSIRSNSQPTVLIHLTDGP